MRVLALTLVAALGCAVPAEAKRHRFAPKRAAAAKKKPAPMRGWRAAPARVVAAPAPAPPAPEAAPVIPSGAPAPAPALPAPEAPAPACDPSPWLGAIAEDVGGFRLRLTRTCVPAGTVLFQFRNNDLAVHNLWIEGIAPAAAKREVVPATRGETIVTASASLPAGKWRVYCSFEGHEAMTRLLDVTPAG